MLNNYVYYINGKWIESNKALIPFNDSGFLYGDGLFETLRFDNKIFFSKDKHITRILSSLDIIKISHNFDNKLITQILNKIVKKNSLNSGLVKIIITRGNVINKEITPCIYTSIKPLYDLPKKPVKVVLFSEDKFPIIRFSPAIKSLNYLGNMLAKTEAEKLGYFEPLFYNKDKIITECAIRNIFFIKDNFLLTPSLDIGVLPGIMRSVIINLAKKNNLKISECHINKNSLNSMDEAFLSSTGVGLIPCYWDGWKSDFTISKILKKELLKSINNS